MFTGIIEETGRVKSVGQNKITIVCEKVLNSKKGDSIAVNGVCLTVTDIGKDFFSADVSQETFRVSTLKNLKTGTQVNLERALSADGRFGGHIVTGHTDSIAKISDIKKLDSFYDFTIELEEETANHVVKKGSVTFDGISLTVADINGKSAKLAIIPHTYENTNLKNLKIGDYVNIETDILSKYVEKFLSIRDNKSEISFDFLHRNGF